MKLLASLLLGTVALAAGAKFDLTVRNVHRLQALLQDKLHRKHKSAITEYYKTTATLKAMKMKLENDIASKMEDFEEKSYDCEMGSLTFWNSCKQCISQQCTSWFEENCGPATKRAREEGAPTENDTLKLLQRYLKELSQFGYDVDYAFEYGSGATFNIHPQVEEREFSTGERSRHTRQALPACGKATLACDGDSCNMFNYKPTYEVTCVEQQPPMALTHGLEFTKELDTRAWKVFAGSTQEFDVQEGMTDDGQTMIIIDIAAEVFKDLQEESDPEPEPETENNEDIVDSPAESSTDVIKDIENFGKDTLGGDNDDYFGNFGSEDYIPDNYYYEKANAAGDDFLPKNFDVLGSFNDDDLSYNVQESDLEKIINGVLNDDDISTDTPNCEDGGDGMAAACLNQPDVVISDTSDGEGDGDCEEDKESSSVDAQEDAPYESNTKDLDDLTKINFDFDYTLSDEQFCAQIGGCEEHALFRRRVAAKQKLAAERRLNGARRRRQTSETDAMCRQLEITPTHCTDIGLDCTDCNHNIADVPECDGYVQLRRKLSQDIPTAAKLVEGFTTVQQKQLEEIEWFTALQNTQGYEVFVQKARWNKETDKVHIAIVMGTGEDAKHILVAGDLPPGVTFETFANVVGDRMPIGDDM